MSLKIFFVDKTKANYHAYIAEKISPALSRWKQHSGFSPLITAVSAQNFLSTPTPSFSPPGGVRGAGAEWLLLPPCWTRFTPSFAPPGGVLGAGARRLLPLSCWATWRCTPSRRKVDVWSRSWTVAATTLLDDVHTFLRAARWRARSRSWTAASTTLLDEVHAFLCTARRSERSWTAAATTLLDEVYTFLRATRWCARSMSWTAAATTLLDEVHAFLLAARRSAQSWSSTLDEVYAFLSVARWELGWMDIVLLALADPAGYLKIWCWIASLYIHALVCLVVSVYTYLVLSIYMS